MEKVIGEMKSIMSKSSKHIHQPALQQANVSSRLNHFQFHGSIIYDEIIENAIFDDYKIVKHELYSDGSFVSEDCKMPFTFLHDGQLYRFLTTHHGAISSFFELNMSKEKCLNGQFGVYYEAVLFFVR